MSQPPAPGKSMYRICQFLPWICSRISKYSAIFMVWQWNSISARRERKLSIPLNQDVAKTSTVVNACALAQCQQLISVIPTTRRITKPTPTGNHHQDKIRVHCGDGIKTHLVYRHRSGILTWPDIAGATWAHNLIGCSQCPYYSGLTDFMGYMSALQGRD